ncbi:MAG: hypothetical protein ACMUHY_02480 [Thermoplasmatota archaeon]
MERRRNMEKKAMDAEVEGTLELGLERIDQDIEKLTERAQKAIEGSEDNFKDCPRCGLPTFMGPGSTVAFCARCQENYDVRRSKGASQLKTRHIRKVTRRTKVIVACVAVGIMALFLSLALFHFVAEDTLDYIDIHDVNDIRGLPKEEGVPLRMISQGELEDRIRVSLDAEERNRLWELQRFFQCMLIIPDSWDLVDIAENESSGAGLAGFYDPEEERMYIIGEKHTSQYVNYVLSHEYTHALQDQNFDLEAYMDLDDYDAELARLCAVEGDAMLTMEMWAEENLEGYEEFLVQLESLAQLVTSLDFDGSYYSEILTETANYPYDGGYDFVSEIYDEGGWDAVNSLFGARPPLSSEQVMHPDKYRTYEAPLNVSFDDPPADYTLRFTSVAGEKLLHELLSFYNGYFLFGSGFAAGWGGDRFHYYENGDEFLSVMSTRWDSEMDNQRFEDDMRYIYDDIGEPYGEMHRIRGNYLYLESRGDSTTVYYGSSEDVVAGYTE